MAGRSLNPATHRRLGGPLPRRLPNGPRGHPPPPGLSRAGHAAGPGHPVLAQVSLGYPGEGGRFLTCYSPVRHSTRARGRFLVRLACVKHAASVHPEPGSNSPFDPASGPAPSGASPHPDRAASCDPRRVICWLRKVLSEFNGIDSPRAPRASGYLTIFLFGLV